MKLDKIRFANVVAFIAKLRPEYDIDVYELDSLIDIEAPASMIPNDFVDRLHTLMALMQEGTRKIEAIRQHRMITGYGLKESKDAVEKYWPDQTPKLSRVELFAKLRAAGYNNDTEFHDIERFIENCFK